MITYYNVFLILAIVQNGVRCQYQLQEYAPNHDNYESYNFAYGVSDPISGDHKHQWERMEHGHVDGEYGLMEPDGMMRLVQYTAGPNEGFKAKVSRIAVQLAKPDADYTQGQELYQSGQHAGERYAAEDTSGLEINENEESIVGNEQPEYVQLVNAQKINQENKFENDYVNQESQHHVIISRATAERRTDIQSSRKKDQTPSNGRKNIVKKNIENDMHSVHPGFTSRGLDYVSNFNLNPINIGQLNIPDREKQILHGLSSIQDNQQQKIISVSINSPKPFDLHNIQNPVGHASSLIPFNSGMHPSIIQFQKNIGSQMHGYQIIPYPGTPLINHNIQEQITGNYKEQQEVPYGYNIHQNLPASIQDVKEQQGVDNYDGHGLNQALEYIHSHPEIKKTLENIHSQHYVDKEEPVTQIKNEPNPRIMNYQNTPVQSYSENASKQSEDYSNPNIPESYQPSEGQSYGQYQQSNPEISYKKNNLSTQNHYPVILVDPNGKLGLPFYPSSQVLHHIPPQEFNYEGIPNYGPNLEGKRYNNENYTDEQRAAERRYLLGDTPGPLFPPPPGYTRETLWQAGDPDADPQPEILVRQLNETCAYIQVNETTPGNEDGKLNIWQAGDYSAQLQEEELIGSINITCENYTADAMANFSSGYTVVDYCWQCVKNEDGEQFADYKGGVTVPPFLPNNIGPNNDKLRQQVSDQDDGTREPQQISYASNNDNTAQQLIYESNGGNVGQNQESYETNVEGNGQKQAQEIPKSYDNPQSQENYQQSNENYQQGYEPMKVTIYPNLGYKNDPESEQYGLYRRSTTRRQKSIKDNVPDNVKPT